MIIVSQDKERTVENLNLGIRNDEENNRNYIIYNTEIGEDLGEYGTKERAKKVFNEIITAYSDFKYYKNASEKEREEISKLMKAKYKHFDTYEMPEE